MKGDMKKMEIGQVKMGKDINDIRNMVDSLVGDKKDNNDEKVIHIETHDRINRDLFKVKNHLNLESMEVVKPA